MGNRGIRDFRALIAFGRDDVLQPVFVVSVGVVGAGLSAAAVPALQGAYRDGFGTIEHEAQLQGEN